jgi:proline iminopeptidase
MPLVLFLHGGPGSGYTEGHKHLFDPERDNVIFYDQRGAGKSLPYCVAQGNTMNMLVEDIPRILAYVVLIVCLLLVVSWGVALAFLFAERYPHRVCAHLLVSVFLATQKESMRFVDGSVARVYQDAWSRFVAPMPTALRDNIAAWYFSRMNDGSEEEKETLARTWRCTMFQSLQRLWMRHVFSAHFKVSHIVLLHC